MKHETAVPVGTGGMGEVFKAWDPDLERYVALKYLRHDDPVMVERLLREARAQARIDHPSVCKVYEVGEDEGRPYIAMEYVDGLSLDKAAEELSLEQKILLIKQITEAVQAAHSAGLVHRDLKPANILVADYEDHLHPYVLDFGIARIEELAGLTMTGQVMGTPGYLSPEQARGDLAAVDRRTDIFSLGVILYELLGGAKPFDGDSNVEILVSLIEQDPKPLRRLAPHLPKDLETVVMTCLEKDPERRYPSAKALTDDLNRFLDGEPVSARPVGFAEILNRRARKHPRTTAATIIAVLAMAILATLAFNERRTAARRADLSRRLGTEVERISSTMRIAHLAPLHDIGTEKARVEERLEWIRTEMERLGSLADGPGNYALGRGHLALGRAAAARDHLETAWASEFTNPETAHALGEAYTELYLDELEIAQRTRNSEIREARVKELQDEYRDPAVAYLKRGLDAPQANPSFIEALLALVDARFDDTIDLARSAAEKHTWLYEARVLEGRAHYQKGMQHLWNGRYDQAREEYHTARATLESAAEIGRSDPATYEALCVNWHLVLEADRAEGLSIEDAYGEILTTCGRAIEADPTLAAAHEKIARAHWRWGEYLSGRGDDPIPAYDKLIAAARSAVEADPNCFRASNLEGLAWWRRGLHEDAVGIDPRSSLERGAEALTSTLGVNPNYRHAHNNLGLIYWAKGRYEMRRGVDSSESFRRALTGFEGAIEVDPDYIYAYNNMAIVLRHLADIEAEKWNDADPFYDRAAETARRALEHNPRYANALNTLARALYIQAEVRLERGLPFDAHLEEAERSLQLALEINPSVADYHGGLAQCRFITAREHFERGEDPGDTLDAALADNDRAHAVNPRFEGGKDQAGAIHLLRAEHAARIGLNPRPDLGRARLMFSEAAEDNPEDNDAHLGAAETALLEARFTASQGGDPTPALQRAREAALRAATDLPTAAPLLMTARIDLEFSRRQPSRGQDAETSLAAVDESVAEVRELAPAHPDAALLAAETALLKQSRNGESGSADLERLDRALENADQALTLRPTHRRTRAVRAALVIERAQLTDYLASNLDSATGELGTLASSDALLRSEFKPWVRD